MTAAPIIAGTVACADSVLRPALQRYFGYDDFRAGQCEVVEAVLAGVDVVLVMPTGGGKSLCYQLPALLDSRPTVVVSPLIALMEDQVDALRQRGIAAATLHSTMSGERQRATAAAYAGGSVPLLYVAPERLVGPDFRALLDRRPPARLVVDEAHCISEWGHDFRRDYLRIGEVAASLAPIQIVACTATATPPVRRDIVARLGQRSPRVFVHGFARPNLRLAAERFDDDHSRLITLLDLLDPGDGHAIVYAGTRARAAAIARQLERAWPTMLYHADLPAQQRIEGHERFRRGLARVAVTTSAFGMGIDVATVRQVFHVTMCASLEEYYQQAGRAGRDGGPATCTVLYTDADRRLPAFFVTTAHPTQATIVGVYRSLVACGRDPGAWSRLSLRHPSVASLSDAAGDAVRDLLRDAGVIAPGGEVLPCDPRHLPIDHHRIDEHRRVAWRRLRTFIEYLTTTRCRHDVVMRHFGEGSAVRRCGDRCDVCHPSPAVSGMRSRTQRTSGFALSHLPHARPPHGSGEDGPVDALDPPLCDDAAPSLDATAQRRAAALRDWRRIAARRRGVPAFVLFTDRTLIALAQRNPSSRGELAAVPGVGPAKLALYGDEVLGVLGTVSPRCERGSGEVASPDYRR